MTQARQEPQVTLTAQGTGPSAQVSLTTNPSRNANLANLNQMIADLLQRIENDVAIDVQTKKKIKERLEEDRTLMAQASLASLDDDNPIKLDKESKGIKDRQDKTKRIFDTDIKDKDSQALLGEIHNMRLTLLQNELNAQKFAESEHAMNLFDTYTERAGEEATGSQPQSRNLLKELGDNRSFSQIVNKGTVKQREITLDFKADGGARSNDPKALGYGMVATGNKEITFGGPPRKALEAARAAFEAGAERFHLDGVTKQYLNDPRAGIYQNYHEWQQLNQEFERLEELYEARRRAKETTLNSSFNENVSAINKIAEEFTKLSGDQDRAEYLNTLSPQKLVDLATELDRRLTIDNKPLRYQLGVTKENFDPYDYIKTLLSSYDSRFGQAFVVKLSEQQSKPEQIDKFKAINSYSEAAQFIDKIKDPNTRTKFYQQIDNMYNSDENFRNEVRAACLGAAVDRYYKASRANPDNSDSSAYNVAKAQKLEVGEIIRGVTPQQLRETVQLYENYFRRDVVKVNEYAKTHNKVQKDLVSSYKDKTLPPDFFKEKEGKNREETLLKNYDEIRRYELFSHNAHEVLQGCINRPSAIPRAQNPVQDFIQIAPRPPQVQSR